MHVRLLGGSTSYPTISLIGEGSQGHTLLLSYFSYALQVSASDISSGFVVVLNDVRFAFPI